VFVEIIYAYLCGRGTVGIRYLQLMLGLRLHTTVCAMRFVVCRDQTWPWNLQFEVCRLEPHLQYIPFRENNRHGVHAVRLNN
jgi:hypothetical protein